MIKFNQGVKVENPRAYEAWAVKHLQYLLEVGSPMERDPRRANFYNVDGGSEIYYIHVSPVSGNVILLARWMRQTHACFSDSKQLAANPA
ncbi:MAG TPA: hypothetical protein VK709_03705 [Candidatus Saccharimonadales bacterium]|jgi:hypothetical protein|nr:hypothetical protein [Candidatus Saccharimonadales bacterium]